MNFPINEKLLAKLKEATLLTQAGQLQDATAMIQQALHGEQTHNESTETEPATGEILEGSFHVLEEQSDVPQPASAHRETAQSDPVQSTAAQKPSAATPGIRGLGDLLRSKLSGLQGLKPGVVFPAEELPEGATFNSGTFANQSGSRDYKLYIPSGYHGQPLPLIVMLHGCTQNPDDFAAGTCMNRLAEEQPCLVLYPAQAASANHSGCWNWFKPGDQRREGGEPAIIAGMTRQIIKEYHVDKRRVYVAGLSAGGAMATTMTMTYPEIYAAVGVHSGLPHGVAQDLPSALTAMQGGIGPLAGLNKQADARSTSSTAAKIPAIIFHGDQDTTVHPSNGDRVVAQHLPVAGLGRVPKNKIEAEKRSGKVPNGHSYTCTIHRDASGQPILEQWSIHGAAHAWAGGTARGSYTDPKGPDASREMLRFFLTHCKDELS